jgi:AcrR family transcriptional regulator
MAMDAEAESPRRRPKGDKRARTQAKLLDAALELTREKGFDRTSLQDIADRAGMTTGAIYGNFKNRDELFMALAQRQWSPIRPIIAPGSSFAEKMAAVADALIASLPERRIAAVGALTFRAYALTHEEVRAQFKETMGLGYEFGAEWFRSVCDEDELPMPAEILVRVINSLIEGLLFQRFLTDDLITDEVIHAAFAALAGVKPGDPS